MDINFPTVWSLEVQGQGVSRFGLSPWLTEGHLLAASSGNLPSLHVHLVSLCVSKLPLLIRTLVRLD